MNTLIVRVGASVSFLVAGVLAILADRERWWPACGWGDFDSYGCVARQDHLYDSLVPGAPWVPTGNSATLVGWSLLALAVAIVLIVPLAARPKRVALPLSLFAITAALAGGASLWAAANNAPVPDNIGAAILPAYGLGGMVALGWAWWADTMFRGREALRHHLLYVCLFLTSGLPHFFFAALAVNYLSHDRSPWDGAVAGGLWIVAGVICLIGFKRPEPIANSEQASTKVAAI